METIGGCDASFNFGPSDDLVTIAGNQVHGHALIWHNQISWCARASSKTHKRDYIQTFARHYCGGIPAIDVVNQALGWVGGLRTSAESPWRALFEDNDHIVAAFKMGPQRRNPYPRDRKRQT